jgi:serine/alanine adding enzyme
VSENKLNVTKQLDEHLWKEFVQRNPQSQIFHTPEMFQVFSQTKGYQPSLWVTLDQNDRPLALLSPVQITLMGGPLRRFTSRAVAYGSVLCERSPKGLEGLRALLSAYNQGIGNRILFTELRNLSDLGELQPVLSEHSFIYEDHLNFLVDLARPQDEIWKSIRSNAKRNVRKAHKSNVIIEDVNDSGRVLDAYKLLKQVYERLHVPLADQSFFRSSFEILYPKDMLKILIAKVNDVDIGVLMLLLHKDIIIYWYTGTLRKYSACRAGDLLVWHTLEWGNREGFRALDFGGAGKPDEEYGVRDFKAKFGGELVNYGRNVQTHAPLALRASKTIYQLARRFV